MNLRFISLAIDSSVRSQLQVIEGVDHCSPRYLAINLSPPQVSAASMRAKLRKYQMQHGIERFGLIILDYLQLIGTRSDGNRASELGELCRQCKAIARDFNSPFLALAQLNRSVEARSDKRPLMSDLRDSGELEQSADVVMTLYREEYYNKDTPNKGVMEICIAKARNGSTGVCEVLYKPETGWFGSLATGV